MSYLTDCRICNSKKLLDVIELGEQMITSRFPIYGDYSTPKTNITLCMCENCGLVQLRETTNSSELYEYEYGYMSGISNTMKTHLKLYQEEITSIISLKEGDIIVDIGSNDSTMLQYYSNTLRRIGVDPTGNQFKQYYKDVELLPTYFTYANFTEKFGNLSCKVISSISMFYDLPNPVQFAKDIYNLLDENGIWTCEQSYLLSMIDSNSIDTICHEHLEYYALKQIKYIADLAGFNIINVFFNNCNGGSFRIYFAKKTSNVYKENTILINSILKIEEERDIMNPSIYNNFMTSCNTQINYLKKLIQIANSQDKNIYIYGASTKGNCLLQYGNINESHIKYAVERNPNKIGKMTSTGIPIIGEEMMRENPPDYLLVLPWHFKDEIIKREEVFLNNGGQFIFPFPNFEIIGSKQKALITGSNGMISQYVKKQFKNYNLYGIAKSLKPEKNIITFDFDMRDNAKLEQTLNIIKPDVIIHLASISSSTEAYNNPVKTLETNGLLTVKLCEIIHKKGWTTKLFNASSSEIYKGHMDYMVKDNDLNMYHSHPYSIAKIMGHTMVDFYRNTYNLPFSNGVIFTTESPLKQPHFLLNKVAKHIKDWKNGNKTALHVGNLDSYRNIIHAEDVANAIHMIVSQNNADNYVICGDESYKMYDLILELYLHAEIYLENKNNVLYEKNTNIEVLIINNLQGNESKPTNIKGDNTKLKNIGFSIKKNINDILIDLM